MSDMRDRFMDAMARSAEIAGDPSFASSSAGTYVDCEDTLRALVSDAETPELASLAFVVVEGKPRSAFIAVFPDRVVLMWLHGFLDRKKGWAVLRHVDIQTVGFEEIPEDSSWGHNPVMRIVADREWIVILPPEGTPYGEAVATRVLELAASARGRGGQETQPADQSVQQESATPETSPAEAQPTDVARDPDADRRLLRDPSTSAYVLAEVAARRHDLGAAIAQHLNAYPQLLDWLDAYGDESTRQAVAERRRRVAPPPPPPPPVPHAQPARPHETVMPAEPVDRGVLAPRPYSGPMEVSGDEGTFAVTDTSVTLTFKRLAKGAKGVAQTVIPLTDLAAVEYRPAGEEPELIRIRADGFAESQSDYSDPCSISLTGTDAARPLVEHLVRQTGIGLTTPRTALAAFSEFTLYDGFLVRGSQSWPIGGAHAVVELGAPNKRVTVPRVVFLGLLALAVPKDSTCVYLTVEVPDGEALILEGPAQEEGRARVMAAKINAMKRQSAYPTAARPTPGAEGRNESWRME